MIKSKYFILKPAKNDIIEIDSDKFSYFEVIDENDKVIDYYDYITIKDRARIDVIFYHGEWCSKVYGIFKPLMYDNVFHEIVGGK